MNGRFVRMSDGSYAYGGAKNLSQGVGRTKPGYRRSEDPIEERAETQFIL